MRNFTRSSRLTFARLSVSMLLVGSLVGCVSLEDPWASQLPEVSGDKAVTLTGRSILNVTDIQHEHLLYVDGQLAARFKNDEIKSFQIPAGPHNLSLTCHTAVLQGGNVDRPFNYNRPSGKTKLAIDALPGDELCLKITYSLLNCAVLEDADPSYCQRKKPD